MKVMDIKGAMITDMPSGGSADDGTKVFFRLILGGRTEQTMVIDQEKLGHFLLGLMRFGALARQDRRKLLGDTNPASPYLAESVEVAGSDPQGLTLQIALGPDFTLDFRLSVDAARKLGQELARATESGSGMSGPPVH